MDKTVSYNRIGADQMHIKIKDMSGKIIDKSKVNINDTKKLAECFIFLEKYGVDLDELYEEIKQRKGLLDKYYFEKSKNPFF